MTSVLGVAFDHEARLYVLETSDASGFPTPGAGKVLRVDDSGEVETIASGLTFPTGMTFGPDGNLYVSHFGFGFPPGAGQVVRVEVPKD
jgi:sugar lactone lactonase YvrE